MEIIEDLEQLWNWASDHNNMKLKGLINRFKYGEDLEERIIALARILQTMRKHRLKRSEHFIRHCLLYLVNVNNEEVSENEA